MHGSVAGQGAAPLAVVVALHDELATLRPLLSDAKRLDFSGRRAYRGQIGNRSVFMLATGMGASSARESSLLLMEEVKPGAVLATGFAGATDRDLSTGDVVIGAPVIDDCSSSRGRLFDPHPELLEVATQSLNTPLTGAAGRLVTVDRVVADPDSKARIRDEHDAIAIDMESAGVTRAANVYDTPIICARVIVDDANTNLPFDADRLIGPRGELRWFAASLYFLSRPALLSKIPSFHARCQLARRNLATFVNQLISRIPTQL